MDHRFVKIILLVLGTLLFSQAAQASLFNQDTQTQFVTADQAFSFDFRQQGSALKLDWQIRPGYYLYRQQLHITPNQASIGKIQLPQGLSHKDEFFGEVEIYKQQLSITVPLIQADSQSSITVTYQGCAEAGFCYPPETRVIPLTALASEQSSPETTSQVSAEQSSAQESKPAGMPFSPLWALLIGIGIAFTPCVLPMYPLISGIILGREKPHSSRRILLLSVVYVQGMALTYTLMGLVVAAAGLQFQAALQHPYVLIGLSVLFVALAMSMFGMYSLQLPSSLQTRLALWSNKQQGGSLFGVFIMGALAGLICSPCTTAPLSAILLYIAQSGNMWAGGGTLYLYALGMGIPLVLVTLFGNRLLPRSGPWMTYVKEAFGFIILALPVFLLERIVGDIWGLRLWSALGIGFFGWAFILSLRSSRGSVRVLQLLLLAALLVAARPLQDWAFGSAIPQQSSSQHSLGFQRIENLDQLNDALRQAKGKRVMLDLYADWCVACKEFEKYTFSDKAVQTALSDTVLLQADVTTNTPQHAELLKHLQVLGLPTILFFGDNAKEMPHSRVTGFMDASEFQQHLQKMQP